MAVSCGDHLEAAMAGPAEARVEQRLWLLENLGPGGRGRGRWWTRLRGRRVCFTRQEDLTLFIMRWA